LGEKLGAASTYCAKSSARTEQWVPTQAHASCTRSPRSVGASRESRVRGGKPSDVMGLFGLAPNKVRTPQLLRRDADACTAAARFASVRGAYRHTPSFRCSC